MTQQSGDVFDANWLSLRESVDHASRARALLPLLAAASRAGRWSRILDLASGTGSNIRYLAPRLPAGQEWTLIDNDMDLLARVQMPDRVRTINRVYGNIATEGISAVAEAHLVTCSALLDLVSETWMRTLAEACRSASCGVLFALTYDGRIEWEDTDAGVPDPADEVVRLAVNAHQTRNKGLGPALGPSAGSVARACFREAGYWTWFLPSPWCLGPSDTELASAVVDGWQRAAVEERPDQGHAINAWAIRRQEQLAGHKVGVTVGHVDMLALPTGTECRSLDSRSRD